MSPSGAQKENPVHSRHNPIKGNVVKRRFRRPKVSMVYIAGIANNQFVTPVPKETNSAFDREKPESMKIWVE